MGSLSLLQQILLTQGLDSLPAELSGRPRLLRILFIFVFGCAGSSLLCRLFSGGGVWASCGGDFSCFGPQALECADFSSCRLGAQSLWHPGSRAQAQWLWHMGLVALQHVGSSWARD